MRRPASRLAFFAALLTIAGLVLLAFQLAGPSAPAQRSAGAVAVARAVRPADAVTPVIGCAQLQATDFSQISGAPTEVTSAATVTINGAAYCEVKGEQPPQLQFDLRLPVSTWTGRYVQEGCGGYCGAVSPGAPAVELGRDRRGTRRADLLGGQPDHDAQVHHGPGAEPGSTSSGRREGAEQQLSVGWKLPQRNGAVVHRRRDGHFLPP